MIDRRRLILGGSVLALSASVDSALSRAWASSPVILTGADLRGSIDVTQAGVVPGTTDDQSARLQAVIDEAARANLPVFLPPGTYPARNLKLRDGSRLSGVAGASRLICSGEGALLGAENVGRIELSDLTVDGGKRWLGDGAEALIGLTGVAEVRIDNCEIVDSGRNGLRLERCGGQIERSLISGAADAGLYAVECETLSIERNRVLDCGNGGILVHRWTKGEDGATVTNNRIARIGAADGGTGEHGNGINIFRADNVIVSGNHVSHCAFSAIRANSASNVQISDNQCLSSGETAIYVEFSFEGAVVSGNLVDGAANGILIVNFNDGGRLSSVTGNLVRNLSLEGPYAHDGAGFGFGIAVEADTVVTGNVIENAPRYGMMLGWGPYLRGVVASGNLIRKTPVGIYVTVVEESGSALISGSTLR